MKKMMLLAMLGVMFLTETTIATEMKSAMNASSAVWIKLEVIFHRPKFNCESGFSICLIVTAGIDGPGVSAEGKSCSVRGALNERNQLIIEIDEVALSKYENGAAIRYFKDKTSIAIPDPYILPEATCRALGSATPLAIKQGNYPVSFNNGVYKVVFQL
ncbi:MAG: hypothetical protein WCK09_09410 [Bacteroidota bacterium]